MMIITYYTYITIIAMFDLDWPKMLAYMAISM